MFPSSSFSSGMTTLLSKSLQQKMRKIYTRTVTDYFALKSKNKFFFFSTVRQCVCFDLCLESVWPGWSLAGAAAGGAGVGGGAAGEADEAVCAEAGVSEGLWGRWFWAEDCCASGATWVSILALFASLNSLLRSCRWQEPKAFMIIVLATVVLI